MREPIIASTGQVRTEVPANRASFSASFQAVEKDAATATKTAADKVRVLSGVLAAYGAETVRTETSVSITPLYDQYRDKQGNFVDNERADKIERYQATVTVEVEVREVRLVERIYATVLSAKPSQLGRVEFDLEPSNESKTQLFKSAVEDATRRARLAAEAAGTKLGPVKLLDPTGRACQTDVLVTGAPRSYGGGAGYATAAPPPPPAPQAGVEELVVTGSRKAKEAGLNPEEVQITLQPPLETMTASACVVFGLL